MTTQIKMDYPEKLPDVLQKTREEFENKAKMAMAVKLFEMKRLSSGMAAALAGVNRITFLHNYGVNMIDLDEEKMLMDKENA